MRITVEEGSVRILSECAVPGCVREVSAEAPRERFEEAAGSSEGGSAILSSVMARVLGAIEGRELPVEGLEELPPMICGPHMMRLLEALGVGEEAGADAVDEGSGSGRTFELEEDEEGDHDVDG